MYIKKTGTALFHFEFLMKKYWFSVKAFLNIYFGEEMVITFLTLHSCGVVEQLEFTIFQMNYAKMF